MRSRVVAQCRRPLRRQLASALLLLLVSGCAFGPPPGGRAAQEQEQAVAACRRRADDAYDITHRGDIYAGPSQVNTPFSANYQPGITDRGLSNLFERDRMVSDCLRNTGAATDRTPPGAPLAGPGAQPRSAPPR